jgi:membrane protein YqaA with SNARE-associated domain
MSELEFLTQLPLKKTRRGKRTTIVLLSLEVILVAGLMIFWISSAAIRHNKSLWVLFFYCFPSEFLISFVPHEPVILFFSKFYSALTVALVSLAGTVLAEALDYSTLKLVEEFKLLSKAQKSKLVEKLVKAFGRKPYLALWVAAFLPVPFYPFRFLTVMTNLPLAGYLAVIITARFPKFLILALIGRVLKIPDLIIAGFFVAMILAGYLPNVRFNKNKKRAKAHSSQPTEALKPVQDDEKVTAS